MSLPVSHFLHYALISCLFTLIWNISCFRCFFYVSLLCSNCAHAFYLPIACTQKHLKPINFYCNIILHTIAINIIADVILVISYQHYFQHSKMLNFHSTNFKYAFIFHVSLFLSSCSPIVKL